MELWDLYDRQRQLIGNNHIRGERIPNGCYHLVVHVWIRNNNDEYLISQRSANCSRFPLMWECVGGSVRLEKATTDEFAQVKWLQKCQIKELFDAELIVDDLQYFFHKVDPVKLEKYPSGEGAPLLRE